MQKDQITLELKGRNRLPETAIRGEIPTVVKALLRKAGITEGSFVLMVGEKGNIGGCEEPAARAINISGPGAQIAVCGWEQEHRYKCFLSGGNMRPHVLFETLRKACNSPKGWFLYKSFIEKEEGRIPKPPVSQPTSPTPQEDQQKVLPQEVPEPEAPPVPPEKHKVSLKGLLEDDTYVMLLLEAMIKRAVNGVVNTMDLIDILTKELEVHEVTVIAPVSKSLLSRGYVEGMGENEPAGPRRYKILPLAYTKVGQPLPVEPSRNAPVPAQVQQVSKGTVPVPDEPKKASQEASPAPHANGSPLSGSNPLVAKLNAIYERAQRYDQAKAARMERAEKTASIQREIERLEKEIVSLNEQAEADDRILADPEYHGARQRYDNILKQLG